jgi:ATP-dependent RNA circularization protein (DNA/RNA ligase family)
MGQYYKYKRTYHLPWSPGTTSDDKIMHDITPIFGKNIVITEKMDGENTNMYSDRIHARSIDSKDHDSRHWVKGLWGSIKNEIPDGWRICGENLYAKHSLYYEELSTYFMVFSIWNEHNQCLSLNDTLDVCRMLNLAFVPIIDTITFDEKYLRNLASKLDINKTEGYVIRNVESFDYNEFDKNVAKWVRAKHVTTDEHWMFQQIVPNKLKK